MIELPQQYIKVKLTYSQGSMLLAYVNELLINFKEYIKPIENSTAKQPLYFQHLLNVFKPLMRYQVNQALTKKNHVLKLNQAERFTLLLFTANYELPMAINFIEHELKNQLFKTDFINDFKLN